MGRAAPVQSLTPGAEVTSDLREVTSWRSRCTSRMPAEAVLDLLLLQSDLLLAVGSLPSSYFTTLNRCSVCVEELLI
jgi:hypothetical protein